MDYNEIVQTALGYADREDLEVTNNVDFFLRIAESRINKRLDVGEMSARAQIITVTGQDYYDLPDDFKSLRDVKYTSDNVAGTVTLEYVNPKQGNDANQSGLTGSCLYTIIAGQLQVIPTPADGVVDLVYHQKLLPLTPAAPDNWLSADYPEIYVFGLLVEISSFVKDAVAANLWDERFQGAMTALDDDDSSSRWSGTPLKVRRAR